MLRRVSTRNLAVDTAVAALFPLFLRVAMPNVSITGYLVLDMLAFAAFRLLGSDPLTRYRERLQDSIIQRCSNLRHTYETTIEFEQEVCANMFLLSLKSSEHIVAYIFDLNG